jgi:hypothetical protein
MKFTHIHLTACLLLIWTAIYLATKDPACLGFFVGSVILHGFFAWLQAHERRLDEKHLAELKELKSKVDGLMLNHGLGGR